MEKYLIDLKSSLVAIDQAADFSQKAIDSKISLLSECVRNILASAELEISQKFDEGFRNPSLLSDIVQDGSAIDIMIKILESMANEIVRGDQKAIINDIVLYFKSEKI